MRTAQAHYAILQAAFVVLIATAPTQNLVAQWVRAPSTEQLDQLPGLVHETLNSQLMQATVGYSVVLPPSYADEAARFPVVYWLHGGGGNECSSLFTASCWQELFGDESIREVIVVYPNAGRSGYMDHHDGSVMMESFIIKELIPHIDARYRTIAQRAGRAVHGFSMGASGALKFAIKYPEMFCAAVAFGGGAIDLEQSQDPFITNILKRNLNGNVELIRQNNTYRMLEANHRRLQELGTVFLLVCGQEDSWLQSATNFHRDLQRLGLACELTIVPQVGHNLRGLIQSQGPNAVRFQDNAFQDNASQDQK